MPRVLAVFPQEGVVKLRLDLAVAHAAFPDDLLHVGVAGGVQRKVADKAQRIGQRGVFAFRRPHHLPGPPKEHPPRLLVHGVAQSAHGVRLDRVVIKQQIRPMQAQIVKLPVREDLCLHRGRQRRKYIRPKTAVCVSGWHFKSPLQILELFSV